MEYEFYLDLFFLWVFFLDLLALYLASCLGRIPMRVQTSAAAAKIEHWLQRQPEASATASLLCFLSFRQRQSFFWRQPGSEASCAGWLFLLGRLESS